MLRSRARWEISESDAEAAEQIASDLRIDRLLARLLVVRGIHDPEQARLFLQGGPEHFHDPFLLLGMREAVERIRLAIRRQEKIRIYGDYDADGVSSTTLMIFLMRKLGASFDYYIPHRLHEGYGLNKGALELAKKQGVSLIVTVDTGISARAEVDYARELGLDVVVTDHHEPPEQLPLAQAVINPKQPGCPYPFKQLAGVGVALKLAHALTGELPEDLLEIAAIGTVADLMPLLDENRLIVKLGLQRMRNTANVGLRALLAVAGVSPETITAGHIGFSLAPRINASGRLEAADAAVRLLISTDEREAELLARELDQLNKERQRLVDEIAKQATEMVEQRKKTSGVPRVIVLANEEWSAGVIGIVASKLLDKYYRPTLILSIDPETGIAKGSARSIAGFDIYQALSACREWFTHFGGHQAAAGMSLPRENIASVEAKLNELAEQWLTEQDFTPILRADMKCALSEVPVSLLEQLDKLAPFGMGNPSPKFVFTGLRLVDKKIMGKEQQHLKLTLAEGSGESAGSMEAVGFGRGHLAAEISSCAAVDLLGELSINEWNGVKKPQIVIQDMRVPHVQVFDWRGNKQPVQKIREMLNLRQAAEGEEGWGKQAIVVGSLQEQQRLSQSLPDLDRAALWRLDAAGGLEALNAPAKRVPFAEAEDVLLYSLPENLGMLRQLIARAERVQRWYALFVEEERSPYVGLPSRDMFKKVYVAMQQAGVRDIPHQELLAGLSKRSGFSPAMIQFMIEVFEELTFIERVGNVYRLVPSPAKKELTSSATFQRRCRRDEVEKVLVYSSSQELMDWFLSNAKNNAMEDVR